MRKLMLALLVVFLFAATGCETVHLSLSWNRYDGWTVTPEFCRSPYGEGPFYGHPQILAANKIYD